jgi:hypothetical protein
VFVSVSHCGDVQGVVVTYEKGQGNSAWVRVVDEAHAAKLKCRSDCDFEDLFWHALSDVEIRVLHDLQESAWLLKSLGCETPECDAVSLDFPGEFTF